MTRKNGIYFIVAFIGIVMVYIIAFFILKKTASDWSTRGQIGDSLNIITSLFSVLGFLVLVATLRMQFKELHRMKKNSQLETGKILIEHYEQRKEILKQEQSKADGPRRANLTVEIRETSEKIAKLYQVMDKRYSNIGEF